MNFATCATCDTINSAIERLVHLVYTAPFLQTKGLSGLDDVSNWEKESLRDMLIKSKGSKSWEDKAESREERHSLAKKLERMGLKGLKDGSEDHQGFNMAITPDKYDSQSSVDSDKDNIET